MCVCGGGGGGGGGGWGGGGGGGGGGGCRAAETGNTPVKYKYLDIEKANT